MKSACAWCGKAFADKNVDTRRHEITHGICQDCLIKIFLSTPYEVKEYLDRLPAPVLLVDQDGVVKTGNKAALKLLNKDISSLENFRAGVVFECVNASLPGGCGNTVHCSACAVRRSVVETYETGKTLRKMPAYLKQEAPGGSEELKLLISTEKEGDTVLLRIDEIKK